MIQVFHAKKKKRIAKNNTNTTNVTITSHKFNQSKDLPRNSPHFNETNGNNILDNIRHVKDTKKKEKSLRVGEKEIENKSYSDMSWTTVSPHSSTNSTTTHSSRTSIVSSADGSWISMLSAPPLVSQTHSVGSTIEKNTISGSAGVTSQVKLTKAKPNDYSFSKRVKDNPPSVYPPSIVPDICVSQPSANSFSTQMLSTKNSITIVGPPHSPSIGASHMNPFQLDTSKESIVVLKNMLI